MWMREPSGKGYRNPQAGMQEFLGRGCRSPDAGMMEPLGCSNPQTKDVGALRQEALLWALMKQLDGVVSTRRQVMGRGYGMWPDLRKDLESRATYRFPKSST